MTQPRSTILLRTLDNASLALFAVVLAVFGMLTPKFLSADNLLNVLIQSSAVGIVATGMTFVLLTAGVDLSVGAAMFLGAAVCECAQRVRARPPGVRRRGVGLRRSADARPSRAPRRSARGDGAGQIARRLARSELGSRSRTPPAQLAFLSAALSPRTATVRRCGLVVACEATRAEATSRARSCASRPRSSP